MEHGKKMILVPQEFFNRINESRPSLPNTISTQLSTATDTAQVPYSNSAINGLDGEMKQILDDTNLNDREKWTQYYQILQRYFQHNKIQRQPVQLDITDFAQSNEKNLSNQDIISTFPISMQKQAERLLNWIKRSNVNICWDQKGEVAVKDHTIEGSNIICLLYTSPSPRDRTRSRMPSSA